MQTSEKLNEMLISDSEFAQKIGEIAARLDEIGQSGYFDSFDGAKMYYEYYPAEGATSNVVVIHGFTEFTKKFTEMIYYFTSLGSNVFIFDQRGHGLSYRQVSDPELAHIDSFDSYVKDFDEFINRIVIPRSNGLSCRLFAHSMGCAVGVLWMQKHPDFFKKAVLSSPLIYAVTGGVPLLIVKRFVTKELRRGESPEHSFRYTHGFDPNADFSKSSDMSRARFEYNLELRRRNRLYQNSAVTNGWLNESFKAGKRIIDRRALGNIVTSVLIFSAGKDTVVLTSYHKKLCRRLKNARMILLPESKHTPFTGTDETIKRYFTGIVDFYEE